MSGYSAFARYYDELTANIDYKKRGEYFHAIIQKFRQRGTFSLILIAELAVFRKSWQVSDMML